MDMIFNELSAYPLASDYNEAYQRIKLLIDTFKEARKNEFNKIRFHQSLSEIPLSQNYSLQDFCSDKRNQIWNSLILGLYRSPFIDDNTKEESQYIENSFFLIKKEEKIKVVGLAAVFISNTLGIAFQSEDFWKLMEYKIEIRNETSTIKNIICVSEPSHFNSNTIQNWLLFHKDVDLIKSTKAPNEKLINLRSDHGYDLLLEYSRRIIKSPYIEGVINSLPFNPHQTKFVKSIKKDGKIEIVLTWTDQGNGIVVQTTGRNIRETEEIAKIIEKEYGKN